MDGKQILQEQPKIANQFQQPICSQCNSPPVVYLSYAQRHFCKKHFLLSFERRVKRTIRDFSLLSKGDTVAVGLSGGKDSTVLLHMLCKIRHSLPFEIKAIAIDEGIASYRTNTIPVAETECKRLAVPLTILRFDSKFSSMDSIMRLKAHSGKLKGSCTYCGVFRRYLLNRGCKQVGANKLAIGHNLDDIAQTVLMNIMRNEPYRLARFSLNGGIAQDEGFVPRIKPLAQIPEREVALYAALQGMPIHYQECPYAHEAFRQHVRTLLNQTEEKYPGTKQRVFNSYLALQTSLAKGAKLDAGSPVSKCSECNEPSSGELCMACLLASEIKQAL